MHLKFITIFCFIFPCLSFAQCPDKVSFQSYLDSCKQLDNLEGIWSLNALFVVNEDQHLYFPLVEEVAIVKDNAFYKVCPLKDPKTSRFLDTEIYLYPTARTKHIYLSMRFAGKGPFLNQQLLIPNAHYFSARLNLPAAILSPYFPSINLARLEKQCARLDYNTLFEFVKLTPKLSINQQAQHFSGTAFVVDAVKGYLITNAHLIGDKERIILTQFVDGKLLKFKAKLIDKDFLLNLALLEIEDEAFKGFSALRYKFKENSSKGQDVFMLGFPQESLQFTEMPTLCSRLGKTMRSGLIPLEYGQVLPGYSGSPLIDNMGNIRGVAMGGETYNRTQKNYALDVNELRTFLIEHQIDVDFEANNIQKRKVYPAMFTEHVLFVETFK